MTPLNRKLWRDLNHLRSQAIAIILVIACGVITYVMFLSTFDSLQNSRDHFYQSYRFAHVFAPVKRAPETLKRQLEEIPGVLTVDTRVVAAVTIDMPDYPAPIAGTITSLPNNAQSLNKIILLSGRYPAADRDDEIIIADAFAESHDLHSGDRLTVIIKGLRKTLHIAGIGLSPEYIYQLGPGSVFPDFERYAVMWMSRKPLAEASDLDGAFNNAAFALDPRAEIDTVIDRIDALTDRYGSFGAYARKDQLSNRFLTEELRQLENLSQLFPYIFLSVAAFLLNVVLTRLVHSQREQIAALKAFGYNNVDIALFYVKLTTVIVGCGVVLGTLTGLYLAQGFSRIYTDFYRLPYLLFVLRPNIIFEAAFISLISGLFGIFFALRTIVRLNPAEAMRPDTPARYRLSLFEHLGIQHYISTPTKMIFRHLSHRPLKSLLAVTGIACAAAIMMSGRFQVDTVTHMMDVQFNLAQRDNLTVAFTDPVNYHAKFAFDRLPGVEYSEAQRTVAVRLIYQHREYETVILGLQENSDLRRVLDKHLRVMELPSSGLLLTDYFSTILGVRPGDTVSVEILEGERPRYDITVAAMVDQDMGLNGYMEINQLNRLLREGPSLTGLYLRIDEQQRETLYQQLKRMPYVAAIAEREREIANFHKTLDETMLFYTTIVAFFGAVIAFGVVYNSARIILLEHGRELASLRVLGFNRGEVAYILFGELAILTLAALPLGLYLGRQLCAFIAENINNELYRVPLIIEPSTYGLAALVVILSALASAFLVYRKLENMNILIALKTKE